MKKSLKPKFIVTGLRLEFSYAGGAIQYTCMAANNNYPIGFMWVSSTSNSFKEQIAEIIDIYVSKNFRRMGVGSYMIKTLLEMYGMLRTGNGTKEGGMALMKSTGWKQNRQTGDWYLRGKIKKL